MYATCMYVRVATSGVPYPILDSAGDAPDNAAGATQQLLAQFLLLMLGKIDGKSAPKATIHHCTPALLLSSLVSVKLLKHIKSAEKRQLAEASETASSAPSIALLLPHRYYKQPRWP